MDFKYYFGSYELNDYDYNVLKTSICYCLIVQNTNTIIILMYLILKLSRTELLPLCDRDLEHPQLET